MRPGIPRPLLPVPPSHANSSPRGVDGRDATVRSHPFGSVLSSLRSSQPHSYRLQFWGSGVQLGLTGTPATAVIPLEPPENRAPCLARRYRGPLPSGWAPPTSEPGAAPLSAWAPLGVWWGEEGLATPSPPQACVALTLLPQARPPLWSSRTDPPHRTLWQRKLAF